MTVTTLDKYDDRHWLVRFTPRKARSKWSQVNRARATQLIEEGRMRPRGFAQIEAAKADGRWEAAYAPASKAEVPADLQAALDRSPAAAAFFATLTGANRYAILYRIGAVKKAETRARKIAEFVAMLERGETVHG
ncbi:MAG TPA: YdeI/OmpD-associated family protein [Allosphingosinicella sp.]